MRSAADGGDRGHQHFAVWACIGGKIGRVPGGRLESRVEDMRDVGQFCELAFRVVGIKKVDSNMPVARPVWFASPRKTDHLPIVFGDEPLYDVTANHTERANNDSRFLHSLAPIASKERAFEIDGDHGVTAETLE